MTEFLTSAVSIELLLRHAGPTQAQLHQQVARSVVCRVRDCRAVNRSFSNYSGLSMEPVVEATWRRVGWPLYEDGRV